MYILEIDKELFYDKDEDVLKRVYKRRIAKIEYKNKKLDKLEDSFDKIDSQILLKDNWMFKKKRFRWELETNDELMETKFLSRMTKKDRNGYLYYKNNDYQDIPYHKISKASPAKDS